jgi:hypothetical protein
LLLAVSVIIFVLALAQQGRSAVARPLQQITATPTATNTSTPQPATDFRWDDSTKSITIDLSSPTGTADFTLRNDGDGEETFTISVASAPSGWDVEVTPEILQLDVDDEATISVRVTISANAASGSRTITIRASTANGKQVDAFLTVTVTTGSPTATPRPGQVCPETPDPGNDRDSAQLIRVDREEYHGICSTGDEDWFKFAALGGKLYSIDITQMDPGLDLALELYDDQGRFVEGNDDYPSRSPTAVPTDTKPLIKSFRAPTSGLYFIRVRDTLGVGGADLTYRIIVRGESYGPTPSTVAGICNDQYEQDGLPELASLMNSNETQFTHLLCPKGDADWITFYGHSGYHYYLYTDTRPYSNTFGTEPGADTVLFLADRDGVSRIAENNNIEGLDTFDSQVDFIPNADGYYFAQVKNIGDVGNMFIKYDITLRVCVNDLPCGRIPPPTPTAEPTPTTEQGTGADTGQSAGGVDTSDSPFLEPDAGPSGLVDGPVRGFADVAFQRVWQRNDAPIVEQRVSRSWMWGPQGRMARIENYTQVQGGRRQVQYFDKGRMEINNPQGKRSAPWFVTSGLLVVEMISGRMQLGDDAFAQGSPAEIPIAGDANDTGAPTYASFATALAQHPGDRTGQMPGEALNREGRIGAYEGPAHPETQLAHFAAQTGHNIPQVFWDYLNARALIYENGSYRNGQLMDWVFTLGYPVSEPYWTRVRVGGTLHDVLVQPFQRRVLTYTPDAPQGWQVEMGNVGRHYYLWRYLEELPS